MEYDVEYIRASDAPKRLPALANIVLHENGEFHCRSPAGSDGAHAELVEQLRLMQRYRREHSFQMADAIRESLQSNGYLVACTPVLAGGRIEIAPRLCPETRRIVDPDKARAAWLAHAPGVTVEAMRLADTSKRTGGSYCCMSVAKLRYGQDSICRTFRNGNPWTSLLTSLSTGGVRVKDIPPLHAVRLTSFRRPAVCYVLDGNRRLHAFKQLEDIINKGLDRDCQIPVFVPVRVWSQAGLPRDLWDHFSTVRHKRYRVKSRIRIREIIPVRKMLRSRREGPLPDHRSPPAYPLPGPGPEQPSFPPPPHLLSGQRPRQPIDPPPAHLLPGPGSVPPPDHLLPRPGPKQPSPRARMTWSRHTDGQGASRSRTQEVGPRLSA